MISKIGDKIIWQRAKDYLTRYKPILIGVAGGYDKTLTREAIALALSGSHKKIRSIDTDTSNPRELAAAILGNSKPGQSTSWWRLLIGSKVKEMAETEPEIIIVEVAVSLPGDIDMVARDLPFQMAVMLNVASTHLDLFNNKQNVAHELLSLPISLPKEGTVVLNTDNPQIAGMRQHLLCTVATYGQDPSANVRLIRADRLGLTGFAGELEVKGKRHSFSFPHIVGRHQLGSMLAAISVAQTMGVETQQALTSLRALKLPAGHMRVHVGRNNSTIIDDSHDASYESTIDSLKTLASIPGMLPHTDSIKHRRIVILGDITNLGGYSKPAHIAIGQHVRENADMFVAVGEAMKDAQAEVLRHSPIDTHHFVSSRDVGKWLAGHLQPHDIVLIKGGKEVRMEQTVKALLEHPN